MISQRIELLSAFLEEASEVGLLAEPALLKRAAPAQPWGCRRTNRPRGLAADVDQIRSGVDCHTWLTRRFLEVPMGEM